MTTFLTLASLDQSRIFNLPSHTLLSIGAGRGGTLRVDRGAAWVTFGDGTEDHLLGAGERIAIDGGGTTVVSPLACARSVLVIGLEPGRQRGLALRHRLKAWRDALRAGVAPLHQA